jgi:hypothetical protein
MIYLLAKFHTSSQTFVITAVKLNAKTSLHITIIFFVLRQTVLMKVTILEGPL